MKPSGAKYLRLLKALRAGCPPVLPVQVRRVKGLRARQGCHGECALLEHGGRNVAFSVRLDAGLREPALSDALLHEWAHALSWTTEHPEFIDHGHEWGLAMARVYRVWESMA